MDRGQKRRVEVVGFGWLRHLGQIAGLDGQVRDETCKTVVWEWMRWLGHLGREIRMREDSDQEVE
jgi:hypothetical protein